MNTVYVGIWNYYGPHTAPEYEPSEDDQAWLDLRTDELIAEGVCSASARARAERELREEYEERCYD